MNAEQADEFDVVAVTIATGAIRLLARGRDKENAEAIVNMAVARRGVDPEFYSTARAGQYQDGDKWRELP